MIQLVAEVIPSVFLPTFDERTWSNGQLVSRSAEDRFHIDPIAIVADVGILTSGKVFGVQRNVAQAFQSLFLAVFLFL